MSTFSAMFTILGLLLFGNILHSIRPTFHAAHGDIVNRTTPSQVDNVGRNTEFSSSPIANPVESASSRELVDGKETNGVEANKVSSIRAVTKEPVPLAWTTKYSLNTDPKPMGKLDRLMRRRNKRFNEFTFRNHVLMPFVKFPRKPAYDATTATVKSPSVDTGAMLGWKRPFFPGRYWGFGNDLTEPKPAVPPMSAPHIGGPAFWIYKRFATRGRLEQHGVEGPDGGKVHEELQQAPKKVQPSFPTPGNQENWKVVRNSFKIKIRCHQRIKYGLSHVLWPALFFLLLLTLWWMLYLFLNILEKVTDFVNAVANNKKKHAMTLKV